MRISPAVRMFLVAFLALAGLARAAEQESKNPTDGLAYLSVRNFAEFIGNVDAFAAAASEGTQSPLPPGAVKAVAAMYNPIPPAAWDLNGEVHVVVDVTAPERMHAFILKVPDAAAFEKAMPKASGARDKSNRAILDVGPLGRMFYHEAPGNLAVLAPTSVMLDRVGWLLTREGWKPEHKGDAAVTVEFPIPEEWRTNVAGIMNATAAQELEKARRSLEKEEFLKGRLKTLVEALLDEAPGLVKLASAEISGIRKLDAAIRLTPERVGFAFAVDSDPKTYVGTLAAATGRLGDFDSKLAGNISASAGIGTAAANPESLAPGMAKAVSERIIDIVGKVFPEKQEEFAAHYRDLLAYGQGENAGAVYPGNFINSSVTWLKSADPVRAADACVNLFNDFAGMTTSLIPDAEQYVQFFLTDEKTAAGDPYKKFSFKSPMAEMLIQIFSGSGQDSSMAGLMDNLRGLLDTCVKIGAKDGQMVMFVGPGDADLFEKAMASTAGAADPLWSLPPVRAAIADLKNRQIATTVMSSDFVFKQAVGAVLKQYEDLSVAVLLDPNFLDTLLADVAPVLKKTDEPLGCAVGGDGKRLLIDFTAGAGVTGALVNNLALLNREAAKYAAEMKAESEEEGYEDEDDEGDGEMEDMSEEEAEAVVDKFLQDPNAEVLVIQE